MAGTTEHRIRARADAAQAARARQARLVAVVIAAAFAAWVGLQWAGARFGWPPRYAFLIDFAALAAFVWSLAVTWRIWRAGRD